MWTITEPVPSRPGALFSSFFSFVLAIVTVMLNLSLQRCRKIVIEDFFPMRVFFVHAAEEKKKPIGLPLRITSRRLSRIRQRNSVRTLSAASSFCMMIPRVFPFKPREGSAILMVTLPGIV